MSIKVERWERFKDARTVYNQHGKESMQKVADETGLHKSMIQATEQENSCRSIGYKYIQKLAYHYGVSIEWLLCLSDDYTIHAELAESCKVTGLSETAIKSIQRETADDSTRLALEVILCSDSDLLHDLCQTVYKAIAGYFASSKMESLLDALPDQQREAFEEILDSWDGIASDPRAAVDYNTFYACNTLSEIIRNSEEIAISKYNEIFSQKHQEANRRGID